MRWTHDWIQSHCCFPHLDRRARGGKLRRLLCGIERRAPAIDDLTGAGKPNLCLTARGEVYSQCAQRARD